MDDAKRAQTDIMVVCGMRQKLHYNICRTTTRQEFIDRMKTWLENECPQSFTALFYDKNLGKMIQLNDNDIHYLAPLFDSIAYRNRAVSVQPLSSHDDLGLKLYISSRDSPISSHISCEAFAGQFQIRMDQLVAENVNQTTIGDLISSENLHCPTSDDLLGNKEFDKVLSNSNDVRQEEMPIIGEHISPTTNIQFRLTDHLHMIHDVCPTPARRNYLSNMGKKGISKLAYLSGLKGPNDRGKQIRPIIRIPDVVLERLREKYLVHLIVACVRETLQNGTRIWWIDKHSEFRRPGCTTNTRGVNPLEIPLTLTAIKNGCFKLKVILSRIPGRINTDRNGELFHSLDDAAVIQLHSAVHDPQSSRLALLATFNGYCDAETIGITNFIQEPKSKKVTTSTQNQTNVEEHIQIQRPTVSTAASQTEHPV